MVLQDLVRSNALTSIATRVAIGVFPILFVLMLRWTWGKQTFDLAAAAINWSMYLNVLLLSGFAMVPPAVARLRRGGDTDSSIAQEDLHAVADHIALSRWLLLVGVFAALVLNSTIDGTFGELSRRHGQELNWWFLMFAAFALAQIPMTLWLGVVQGLGQYGRALVLAALPRAAALLILPLGFAAGFTSGPVIAIALLVVLSGQAFIGSGARQVLKRMDRRILDAPSNVARVLPANLSAGLVVLVGAGVTIIPVTLVGRWLPEQVGTAHVIVGLANAMAGVVVAALFPASLMLREHLGRPGGIRAYCCRIGSQAGLLTLAAAGSMAGAGLVCTQVWAGCHPVTVATASMVLAGAGLRLGALGTQHVALYRSRPQLNLVSAIAEAALALVLLVALLPDLGLVALGFALLAGGMARLAVSLSIERRWLEEAA